MIVTFLLFFAGCITVISISQPAPVNSDPSMVNILIGGVLALYEVVVRVVPSVKDYSVISTAIRILKKISDSLNYIKKPPA